MKTYVVLLRAVTPSGKNKVPMAKLREVLSDAGFENVCTYGTTGNVVLESHLAEKTIAARVHDLVKKHIGPDLDTFVRTSREIQEALDANPFPGANPSHVLVTFLEESISKKVLKDVSAHKREEIVGHKREVYVYYPKGASQSKLKLPEVVKEGTARNMSTVSKLAEMSER